MITIDHPARSKSTQPQSTEVGSKAAIGGAARKASILGSKNSKTNELRQPCAQKREMTSVQLTPTESGITRNSFSEIDQIQIAIPKGRNQSVHTQTIDLRSRDLSNVEETILALYHAELLIPRQGGANAQQNDNYFSHSEITHLHKQVCRQIEMWRKRPITKIIRYVFLAGIEMSCHCGSQKAQASILMAEGVDEDGVREVLGVMEGPIHSDTAWLEFLRQLKRQGLFGVYLFIGERCAGLADRLSRIFPGAQFQNSFAQFHQEFLAQIPAKPKLRIEKMLDCIFASSDWSAASKLITELSSELKRLELSAAAEFFEMHVWESMNYLAFPRQHQRLLKSNCTQKDMLHSISEQTRLVGIFPDGPGAVHLVSARLRHIESKASNAKRAF